MTISIAGDGGARWGGEDQLVLLTQTLGLPPSGANWGVGRGGGAGVEGWLDQWECIGRWVPGGWRAGGEVDSLLRYLQSYVPCDIHHGGGVLGGDGDE